MSDYNYTYFREKTQCSSWPTIHYVRLAREELNRLLPAIHENVHGIFYNAIERISWVLEFKFKTLKLSNKLLKICLRGDKTLSGNQSFFNFCFSIPDEGNLAKTAFGQYSLGVFAVKKDDHETMDVALDELSESMRNFKFFNNHSIDWHLGGDMVWMKTERGLNGCNSKNPCFLCELPRDKFYKNNHELLAITEKNEYLRTLDRSEQFRNKKDHKGYIKKPIFDFIPFENCHHDTLHEIINIVKYLLSLTHKKLLAIDANVKGDPKNLANLPAQKKLFDWLESIGVYSPYRTKNQYSNPSDPNFQIRTFLSGDECLQISRLFNEEVISSIKEKKKITLLFNDYHRLHQGYTHNFYMYKSNLFRERAYEWKTTFNSIFHTKHNTTYIHYFTDHLASAIEKHGDIDNFNIQG